MGLRKAFQKAAVAAMEAAGDVLEDAQYYNVASTTYDATTGRASALSNQYLVSGIFTKFSTDKIDDEKILPSDVKFIVTQIGFQPEPSTHDYVRRIEHESSVQYDVVNFEQDPAEALWMIQLRKS